MSKRTRIAGGALAVALAAVWLGTAGAAPVPQSSPTLDGVWKARGKGLLVPADGRPVPLKPAAAKAYQASRAAFLAGDPKVDPTRRCKPPGEPRLMIDPAVPFAVLQTGPRIMVGYQWNRLVRMIEMGPPRDVIGPVYFGQNAGSWQGDTLVVDVRALHDNTYLDRSGLPHGPKAHLVERFRLVDPNVLQASIHVEDPDTFMYPWDAQVTFDRQPGTRVKEDICLDREGLVGKLKESDAPIPR